MEPFNRVLDYNITIYTGVKLPTVILEKLPVDVRRNIDRVKREQRLAFA